MEKYHNFVQFVQGVSQIDDDSLTATERCFLNVLAAHSVKENPHPGNERLARGCGITTRQGVNKISKRLIAKRLIEIRGNCRGGRGMAVEYRIRTEDPRFPPPKPATPELPVSDGKPATSGLRDNTEKPATGEPETRNSDIQNPQLDTDKPATPELHPNLDSEYKSEYNPEANPQPGDLALPDYLDPPTLKAYLKTRKAKPDMDSLFAELWTLKQSGQDVNAILRHCAATGKSLPSPIIQRRNGRTQQEYDERSRERLRRAGLLDG